MRTPLLALLVAAAALTACSDDPPARTAATAAPTTAPLPSTTMPEPAVSTPASATAAATGPAPFRADERPDTAEAGGEPLTVTAVRSARQDGFDRVVFELRGRGIGVPGWRVEYVDRAEQQGSGDTVDVDGQAVLQVVLTGIGYPFDTGQEEASQDLRPGGSGVVREVDLQGTYEGQFQAFVGLTDRRAFRVFRLADPARVVVDVADTAPGAG